MPLTYGWQSFPPFLSALRHCVCKYEHLIYVTGVEFRKPFHIRNVFNTPFPVIFSLFENALELRRYGFLRRCPV